VDDTWIFWADLSNTIQKMSVTGGAPTPLATGAVNAQSMAIDRDYVYWATMTGSGSAVARVAKAGGAVQTIASDQNNPSTIQVDSESAYWSVSTGVKKAPLGGGPVVTIFQQGANYLALDQGDVYMTSAGTIYRIPKTGGSFAVLGRNLDAEAIRVDQSFVYYASRPSGAGPRRLMKLAK
jgi:hypothetical protein